MARNLGARLAAGATRLIADEVDHWPLSAGTGTMIDSERGEGDPLTLAEQRQQAFFNRKTLFLRDGRAVLGIDSSSG